MGIYHPVRVFTDASFRNGLVGLGAAILLPDTSPVLLSWALTDIPCSTTAEHKAVQWAGRQTQKLLKHDVDRTWTYSCINIFNDNQSVAFKQQNFSGRDGLYYHWISRNHSMMKVAHRIAKQALNSYAQGKGEIP